MHLSGKSAVIVVQAARRGNEKKICGVADLILEALPMIVQKLVPKLVPKNLAGGMEFLATVGLSALAGLLAFLFVSLIANVLGLSGG